jgi:uncharacterized protein (TIGR02118 family)
LTTKISIFYRNAKGSRFDMRYYIDTHMPLAVGFLSTHPGYKSVSVDLGISGVEPRSDPAFAAMCHFCLIQQRTSWRRSCATLRKSKVTARTTPAPER